jgi:hypothetical protein
VSYPLTNTLASILTWMSVCLFIKKFHVQRTMNTIFDSEKQEERKKRKSGKTEGKRVRRFEKKKRRSVEARKSGKRRKKLGALVSWWQKFSWSPGDGVPS